MKIYHFCLQLFGIEYPLDTSLISLAISNSIVTEYNSKIGTGQEYYNFSHVNIITDIVDEVITNYGNAISVSETLRQNTIAFLTMSNEVLDGERDNNESSVLKILQIASYFNAEMVICDKHRKRANEIASMVVIGEVAGKDIVLVDDICDTAGTLCKAAELLIASGASEVHSYITHGVLSGPAVERITKSVMKSPLLS